MSSPSFEAIKASPSTVSNSSPFSDGVSSPSSQIVKIFLDKKGNRAAAYTLIQEENIGTQAIFGVNRCSPLVTSTSSSLLFSHSTPNQKAAR